VQNVVKLRLCESRIVHIVYGKIIGLSNERQNVEIIVRIMGLIVKTINGREQSARVNSHI